MKTLGIGEVFSRDSVEEALKLTEEKKSKGCKAEVVFNEKDNCYRISTNDSEYLRMEMRL